MFIAPSLLAADFTCLGNEIESVSSADWLHFDVMDGNFVPNISFGIPILESVRRITDMPLDVHLMIAEPHRFVRSFCESGADIVTFHIEACSMENTDYAIREIRDCGRYAGISLKPSTPIDALLPFLPSIDLVLVMTVEPGFGGQSFMENQLQKLSELNRIIKSRGLRVILEVDGGINADTAKLCRERGADALVAGNDVFAAPDRARRIAELRGSAV